jgi:CRISPR-associated endonuclease/helicase Cas3
VLRACRQRATESPGLFSLTVPTGGGKTLSALAFALAHAAYHQLQRVIVVIPYTSIIEQNAKVYRDALGKEAVIEHHSALDPEDPARETPKSRIACESWDAPIVVTTSVQLFESLFANRSSACRKLHNLARAVIVLDEVQTLPPGLLAPILDALRDLADVYGSTVVLSTATQPALKKRDALSLGLEDVREIAVGLGDSFTVLRRTRVNWPADLSQPEDWSLLAARVAAEPRALAIVHQRADARTLLTNLDQQLGDKTTYHLSALMCPAHRLRVINEIRAALRGPGSVRVVSTQLVEAGVDLDFPVVFRALGGIDSITQAAGRCNREGELRDANGQPALGMVNVFVAESQPPVGVPRTALDVTRTMLASNPQLDLFTPEAHEAFFRHLYFARDLDAKGIQAMRQEFQFRAVGRAFQMIEDGWQEPVVVRYGEAAKLLDRLRYQGVTRGSLRALQRFTVSIPKPALADLAKQGAAQLVEGNVWAISAADEHLYDNRLGLLLDSVVAADPETLIG